jgi:hypothetical protein
MEAQPLLKGDTSNIVADNLLDFKKNDIFSKDLTIYIMKAIKLVPVLFFPFGLLQLY